MEKESYHDVLEQFSGMVKVIEEYGKPKLDKVIQKYFPPSLLDEYHPDREKRVYRLSLNGFEQVLSIF